MEAEQPYLLAIAGTVIDQHGKPIENVTVLIDSLNAGTATDATGYFSIFHMLQVMFNFHPNLVPFWHQD